MKLHQLFLTNNDCYKTAAKMVVKGLMLHSTGANNPKLSRYVGPDDGLLGVNKNNNHWNQPKPDGRKVCPHGFIGKDKNGEVRTYQTLPWNYRGWHGGGSSNDSYIGVEICEDDLKDPSYFNAVYREAVELFAYLCKQFNLTVGAIIDHSEGYKKGIASNHGDVMHWFPKYGKSMDTFRADVAAILNSQPPKTVTAVEITSPTVSNKTIDQLAKEVIDGKHGSGDARKKSLGDKYNMVQARVNELLGAKPVQPKPAKTIAQLADEVIRGMHGSGRERQISLGSNYTAVQAEVNRRLRNKK